MAFGTTLQTYVTDVLRDLHDEPGDFYSPSNVSIAVNRARRKMCEDTGCLRSIQIARLSQGAESYNFGSVTGFYVVNGGTGYTNPTVTIGPPSSGGGLALATATQVNGVIMGLNLTSPGTGYLTEPIVTISDPTGTGAVVLAGVISQATIDIIQVTAIWNAQRYPLNWLCWTDFSANLRGLIGFQQQPLAFTTYGQQQLYIAPVPNQTYGCELDTSIYPQDLVNLSDPEVISIQYQDPIQYYACYVLKMKEQSFQESDWFYNQYKIRMQQVIAASQTRAIPNVFSGR